MKAVVDFFTSREGSLRKDFAFLAAVFGFSFFEFLGKLPLLEPDEGRYAEIPREMLELQDFVTPHLNYVKYFEKPPLLYWLNAISLKIFGHNEFAARFPTALCGLLTVIFVYFLGRRIFGRREGLLSAIILGTSVGFLVQGRINIIDMLLTFCLTASFGFFLLGELDEKKRPLYYHLFFVFSALAVLAKGLIGMVLPGGVIFLYLLATSKWKLLREIPFITGTLLFLAIASPWFVLVSLRNPEFPYFFFIHEHFQRYTTTVHGRYEPAWFFIPVLIGCMLPWSPFLPATAVKIWRERKGPEGEPRLFLLLWAIFIFAFFSFSDSKLIPYILPVFPPLALLVGDTFADSLFRQRQMKTSAVIVSAILAILGTAVLIYPLIEKEPRLSIQAIVIIGTIFLCQGLVSLLALQRKKMGHLFLTLSVLAFLITILGPHLIMGQVAESKSSKTLALAARQVMPANARLVSYGWYEQGLPFYAQQRVMIAGDPGELAFGMKNGNNTDWFVQREQFCRMWEGNNPLFAVLKDDDLNGFKALTTGPVTILGKEGHRILITNK